MLVEYFFYLVFFSQIMVISYYYPKQIKNRINDVLQKYPPASYPKLYPQSVDSIRMAHKVFAGFNSLMVVIGFALMAYYWRLAGYSPAQHGNLEKMPLIFGLIQFIPFMLMELISYKQMKLMRQADVRHKRTAELLPRRLFAFISPWWLACALALILVYLGIELYLAPFDDLPAFLIKVAAVLLSNALFAYICHWHLHGKKLDPYLQAADRSKTIAFSLHSMAFVSIIISLFMIVYTLIESYALNDIEVILNSLYFQLIAIFGIGHLLRSLPLKEINFDVYKADQVS